MNKRLFYLFTASVIALSTFNLQSCKKGKGCGKTKVSSIGSSESHNNGNDCLTCHKSGGEGEGCFNLAGSVYDSLLTTPLANAVIRLYSEPNGAGNLLKTIEGDALGNFYSTDDIQISGAYPAVTGPTGVTKYMSSPLPSGSCNSCHGNSTNKLWSK